ncbi:MAG: lysophospholipid acyltransferase family protein [Desulfosalsimonadaceae bacterium]|nr:lysophospholipid acyltransferase family protein [Desulfosalsimonadaceae bacterium]
MIIKKSFKNTIQYYAALSVITILRRLPRRVGIAAARGLAAILYCLLRKQRNNTINHLTSAFGNEKTDKEIRHIARSVFRHFLTAGVDAARIPIFIKEGMDRYIRADNMHYFEDAYAGGKGMILLTAHFGNWELLGAWLTWKGYPLRAVGSPLSNPLLDQLITDTRNQAGYINIARGTETREIIRTLKQGCPLGILMDQDTRVKGVFVDFFGRKANTPVGPVLLARRFNIPIIPAFMHLEPDLTYHVECLPPIKPSAAGDPKRDLLADVQQCSDVYERIIREHPEQWAWFHRRWRREPEAVRPVPGETI